MGNPGRHGFKVAKIPGNEPKRFSGKRKMRPFVVGWEFILRIIREYKGVKNDQRRQ